MAKILITESVHPIGPELLTAAGHTVVYADRDMDIIRREIVDADAVLGAASSSCPARCSRRRRTSRSSPSTAWATIISTSTTARATASP